MQKESKNVSVAKGGDELAIAIDGVTIGRQLEGDECYTLTPKKHAKIIDKETMDTLSENPEKHLRSSQK